MKSFRYKVPRCKKEKKKKVEREVVGGRITINRVLVGVPSNKYYSTSRNYHFSYIK